jgi:hypothetical protein
MLVVLNRDAALNIAQYLRVVPRTPQPDPLDICIPTHVAYLGRQHPTGSRNLTDDGRGTVC